VAKKGLSGVSLEILELLRQHPDGLTSGEIREKLHLKAGEQMQLDRRKRDLYKLYIIEKTGSGSNPRYVYRGERSEPLALGFTQKVSAQIRHRAHGRCAMCGKTIDEDHIKLVVDHKIPQSWGGTDDPENLWAICEECNAGKKDYFESFDPQLMRGVMAHESPHMRIGELLKMYFGKPVPGWLIEFVAFDQEDWKKRTRELRYLGWDIRATRKKNRDTNRVEAFYTLNKFTKWIENPTKWIRDFEAARAKRNRGEDDEEL
jgi:HNH endonuclease